MRKQDDRSENKTFGANHVFGTSSTMRPQLVSDVKHKLDFTALKLCYRDGYDSERNSWKKINDAAKW